MTASAGGADGADRSLAVVGAGWAGLAAAVEGVRRGWRVTLFEMAAQPGGRARSFLNAGDGVELDNGQHILIGAYVETLALMRTVGVDPERALYRMPLQLVDAVGHGLRLGGGPPALAFARAVLAARGWALGERCQLLAVATGWAARGFRCDPAATVATLTARLPAVIRHDLIDPLCVAALNTPAATASGATFLRVLQDALFAGPGSADLLLPRVGLSALLPEAAVDWLVSHGARVRAGVRVGSIAPVAREVSDMPVGWGVDGERFDAVVVAASPVEAARLVRPLAPDWAGMAAALRHEPIVTVYVRGVGARLPLPLLALAADEATAPAQFVFDRGALGGPPGLLAFVVSGARGWVERGVAAIEAATRAQAAAALGTWLGGPVSIVRTVTEKRATFDCTPGLVRAPTRILPGLTAAGDHVAGPYPATLEGSVRSGRAAVEAL